MTYGGRRCCLYRSKESRSIQREFSVVALTATREVKIFARRDEVGAVGIGIDHRALAPSTAVDALCKEVGVSRPTHTCP